MTGEAGNEGAGAAAGAGGNGGEKPAAGGAGAGAGAEGSGGAGSGGGKPAADPAATGGQGKEGKEGASAFKVPDAYKDKPWASKIKSEDDLYKQIDTLDTLKGKKTVVPDFKTAKPEEVEAYFNALRPAEKTAYTMPEGADKVYSETLPDILHSSGISEYQSGKLMPQLAKLQADIFENATSAEGFKDAMTKSFGDKFDGVVAGVVKEHKTHLSVEDQKMMDTMPNEYLAMVYRLTENMRKAYGASESGDAHVEGKGGVQPPDIGAQRKQLRADIAALDSKPHTAEDRQKLVDALQATYKK